MPYEAIHGPLQLRVALLGNPCEFPEWTEAQMRGLAEIGFNAVQLNIAWLCRPNDEALNLRDVVRLADEEAEPRVAERREELLRRCAMARRHGLRTIFHFGSPFMWRNPYTGQVDRNFTDRNHHSHFTTDDPWYDTLNPRVVEYEVKLLKEFRRSFPDVNDIMVYTYDQDAWQAKEFGNSKYSRGIPLHERLPEYLKNLHRVWTEGREEHSMMWWEPWELSAGQVYQCLPRLPNQGFGLMLHNNIAEAQLARPVDAWFRNTARLAMQLGIPVVGEGFFCSMTEEIEPLYIPCPRLTDEQFLAMTGVTGVVGIKEYFGVLPLTPDLSLDLFRARLAHPKAPTERLMNIIVRRFGRHKGLVRRMLDLLADGIQFYPWDATWFARATGRASLDHGWTGATVRGQICETPSWDSSRRAHFMMTDDRQPHPFLLEDVQLRIEMAVRQLSEGMSCARELAGRIKDEPDHGMFERIARDVDAFIRVARSFALHLRLTNVAEMLRGDLAAGRPMMPRLLEEMERLLEMDAENQHHQGRVLQMQALFREDPETFIRTHLVPQEETLLERGYHSLTTR